jgi:hypothetical protein
MPAIGRSCGDTLECYESRTLLSASPVVATVAEAVAEASSDRKIDQNAKTPVDFSGMHNLSGSLGPGVMNVVQNGANVSLTITFYQRPIITNVPLEGVVHGNKLKASLQNPFNGLSSVKFKAKLPESGLSWSIRWHVV